MASLLFIFVKDNTIIEYIKLKGWQTLKTIIFLN
jgi:hypothetical protein